MFFSLHFPFTMFFIANHEHPVFYNVHFTLCSTVCRSDFLDVSVQLKKTYCVLQYAFHTMFYSVLVWFSRFFSATHSYIGFYTVHFPFSVFPCNLLTYYVLQWAFHTMFYYVPALFSRLFSFTHSYTVFSTGNFQFSIWFRATHSYTMFHNVHFTLCLQCAGLFF